MVVLAIEAVAPTTRQIWHDWGQPESCSCTSVGGMGWDWVCGLSLVFPLKDIWIIFKKKNKNIQYHACTLATGASECVLCPIPTLTQIVPNYHTMLHQVVVLVGAGAFVHLASSFLNCESEIQPRWYSRALLTLHWQAKPLLHEHVRFGMTENNSHKCWWYGDGFGSARCDVRV